MSIFTSLQSSHTLVLLLCTLNTRTVLLIFLMISVEGVFGVCSIASYMYIYSATSSYPNIFLDLWYYTILFVPCVKFFHCLFCPKVFRPSGPELRKQIWLWHLVTLICQPFWKVYIMLSCTVRLQYIFRNESFTIFYTIGILFITKKNEYYGR